ncbi:MAG: hypothetical protein KRP56_05760 [Candidatus Methanogranum gryphiswaldense]|nr:MAG: hypothetical protein KRP56_05760 [Candidatus Methanogranum sp. U3.2.1]
MDIDKIMVTLSSASGIRKVIVPDKDVVEEIFDREGCIEDTTFGMPMDNRALAACKERSMHIVVFCDYNFEVPTDHVMTMEDDRGNIVGFDIPAGKQEEYIDRTDIVWLSDDFVLSTNADSDIAKVVMHPQKVRCIGEGEGVRDPIIFYPATTTDVFLKERFGVDINSANIASALLSFNKL